MKLINVVINNFVRQVSSCFISSLYEDCSQMSISMFDHFPEQIIPIYHLHNISHCNFHIHLKINISQIELTFFQSFFILQLFRICSQLYIHVVIQARYVRYHPTILYIYTHIYTYICIYIYTYIYIYMFSSMISGP
jgi:hypothetical protein